MITLLVTYQNVDLVTSRMFSDITNEWPNTCHPVEYVKRMKEILVLPKNVF